MLLRGLKMLKLFKSRKGIELTMQVVVIVIILLVVLAFLLIFFTGQGTKLTEMWNAMVSGGIGEAEKLAGP